MHDRMRRRELVLILETILTMLDVSVWEKHLSKQLQIIILYGDLCVWFNSYAPGLQDIYFPKFYWLMKLSSQVADNNITQYANETGFPGVISG